MEAKCFLSSRTLARPASHCRDPAERNKRKLPSPSDLSHVRACKGPASKAGRKFKKRFPRIDFEHLRPGPGPGGPKDTQGGLGTHRAGEEAQGSLGGL